nr:EamA family transporter [Pseudoalteromonas luteoviolacea]
MACGGFALFFVASDGSASIYGIILLLTAAIFWSLANIVMKRAGQVNLLHFMVWVSLIPPLPLFILSYIFETSTPFSLLFETTEKAWFAMIYVGYVSTLLAFALWGWLMVNYPVANVAPFALLIPLVGIIGANVLLGEQLKQIELLGGGIILLGLAISVLGQMIFDHIKGKKRQNSQPL